MRLGLPPHSRDLGCLERQLSWWWGWPLCHSKLFASSDVVFLTFSYALSESLSTRGIVLPWVYLYKVLVFDGTSALCGSSPWTVEDFMDYDWVREKQHTFGRAIIGG